MDYFHCVQMDFLFFLKGKEVVLMDRQKWTTTGSCCSIQEGATCWSPLHYWVSSSFQVSCCLTSCWPSIAPHTSCIDLHLDRKQKICFVCHQRCTSNGFVISVNVNLQMSGQSAAKTHTLLSPRHGQCKVCPDPAWKSHAASRHSLPSTLTAGGAPAECGLNTTPDLPTIETTWSLTAVGGWTNTRCSSRETCVRETAPRYSPI